MPTSHSKRAWQVERQFSPTSDAQNRWDSAYQYLVNLSVKNEVEAVKLAVGGEEVSSALSVNQEVSSYASSNLCASINAAPDTTTDH